MEDKLLYRDEVYAIQGALFDVYKTMGNMWGEEVYQQCLEKELALRNIPFEAKKELPIFYKGEKIETKCKLGLLINFGSYPRVTIERFAL